MSIIYLSCLSLFLIPVCVLISYQLYTLFSSLFVYYITLDRKNKIHDLQLIKIYISRKKWLDCILLVERELPIVTQCTPKYFYYLGTCYFNMRIYSLANYYYFQVLKYTPNDLNVLFKIAETYTNINQIDRAINTYLAIIKIDPQNYIAKHSINILTSK